MAKGLMKNDWWVINGWLFIGLGALILIDSIASGNIARALFSGGMEALMGVALFQRSKVVFWIVLVLSIYGGLSALVALGQGNLSISSLFALVPAVTLIILWQQVRKEKGKK